MNIETKEIKAITTCLQDDISREVFANNILYSLTGDVGFLRNMCATTPEGKQFEKILDEHKHQIKILFGAGQWGGWIKNYYNTIDWECFADNEIKELFKHGLPIIVTNDLIDRYKDTFVVITSKYHWEAIEKQLIDMGFLKENICSLGKLITELEKRIYFDLPVLTCDENEIFIDAGAFNGQSSIDFCKWADGKWGKIYIFEPDTDSLEKCRKTFNGNNKVNIIPKGLWNEEKTLFFEANGSESKFVEDSRANEVVEVSVTTLDEILQGEKATFIKMDIEGAELNALLGCENTIRKYKPKLAISVYHNSEDIYKIPELLLKMNPNYKFYLRHYSLSWFDTILYAI